MNILLKQKRRASVYLCFCNIISPPNYKPIHAKWTQANCWGNGSEHRGKGPKFDNSLCQPLPALCFLPVKEVFMYKSVFISNENNWYVEHWGRQEHSIWLLMFPASPLIFCESRFLGVFHVSAQLQTKAGDQLGPASTTLCLTFLGSPATGFCSCSTSSQRSLSRKLLRYEVMEEAEISDTWETVK